MFFFKSLYLYLIEILSLFGQIVWGEYPFAFYSDFQLNRPMLYENTRYLLLVTHYLKQFNVVY